MQYVLLNKKQCEKIIHLHLEEVCKLSVFGEELDAAGIVNMHG